MATLNKDAGETAGPPGPVSPSDDSTLNVGLFPYVPRPVWFQAAVSAAWAQTGSPFTLNFATYDCYAGPPTSAVDVFVFDTIFATAIQPYACDLPPVNMSDFYRWAPAGLQNPDTNKFFALPYLGCIAALIYREDDRDLHTGSMTVATLQKILGNQPPDQVWPPSNTGLLLDFTGGTTVSCDYLQSQMEATNQFPVDPALPDCPAGLDPNALGSLQTLVAIGGRAQAAHPDPGTQRSDHFTGQAGQLQSGRALLGVTESFAFFDNPDLYTFRPMPLSTASYVRTTPVYCDAVAVNSQVPAGSAKQAAAIQLLNVMLTTGTMLASFTPPQGQPIVNPQFLIPVRPSVMAALTAKYPASGVYGMMANFLANAPTTPFRIGAQSYFWLAGNKSCIRSQVLGPGTTVQDIDEFTQPGYASTPAGLLRRP